MRVRSSGDIISGVGKCGRVRYGFWESAASSAGRDSGATMSVMSYLYVNTGCTRTASACYTPVTPMRLHQSSGYHIIGLFAIGMSALGKSFGFELNGARDSPGPQSMKA